MILAFLLWNRSMSVLHIIVIVFRYVLPEIYIFYLYIVYNEDNKCFCLHCSVASVLFLCEMKQIFDFLVNFTVM